MAFTYQTYGLAVHSELEIPELQPAAAASLDVVVRFGTVPTRLADPIERFRWIEYDAETCLLRVEGIAAYFVEKGKRITIELDAGPYSESTRTPADARLFLLGTAFAAILHQRRMIPLHVSGVAGAGGIWAFTGPSGAGKSTLAAWLSSKLHTGLFSDDVAAMAPRLSGTLMHPGPRRLKLVSDAASFLGCDRSQLIRSFSRTDKYEYQVDRSTPVTALPLRALVVLERGEPGENASLTRLKGLERFRACRQTVYRPYMSAWFRNRDEYIKDLTTLAGEVDIWRYRRPWSLDELERSAHPLLEQMGLGEPIAAAHR